MCKIPSSVMRTCFVCETSTLHKVKAVKSNTPSAHSKINRTKARKPGTGNRGKFSKVVAKKVKTSKKPHLTIYCSMATLGDRHVKRNMIRPRTNRYVLQGS